MELKNSFNKRKKIKRTRAKLKKKTLIERWNWKQKKLQQKGQGKTLKKNKDWNEKQNIWKIIIEWLN